jgi:hypothetical protein
MYEPFKSIKPGLASNLQHAAEATQLSFSQLERVTAVALSEIKKNTDYIEDQLDAAIHLKDPSNLLRFFQEQFSATQTRSSEIALTLFELSQEFHAELTQLAETYWREQGVPHACDLPEPAQTAVDFLQQAIDTTRTSLAQASRASKKAVQPQRKVLRAAKPANKRTKPR